MLFVPWLLPLVVLGACAVDAAVEDPAPSIDDEVRAAVPAPTHVVHRSGTQLLDGAGAPLVMKGVNLGGWLLWEGWIWGGAISLFHSGDNAETQVFARLVDLLGAAGAASFREHLRDAYVTEADIARIAALGFNSVRVPFNHALLETDDHPFQYLESGFARLDQLIAWGEAHHVYVVLDLHSTPGGQCTSFPDDPDAQLLWQNSFARTRTVALWRAIAARYRDRAWVAGYDLMNEPCNGSNEQLRALSARIVAAIRQVDPDHLVIVEGNTFATDFTGFPQRLDENQAYSYHTYNFVRDDRAERFPIYAALAAAQQVPLWVGEFGEASADYLRSTVAMFKDPQFNVTGGWAVWTWKRAPSAHPVLQAIAIPPLWQKTINWITVPAFHARPSALEAALGAAQFLSAITLDHCTEDTALATALR